MARTTLQVARICGLISIGAVYLCDSEGYYDHSSASHDVHEKLLLFYFMQHDSVG